MITIAELRARNNKMSQSKLAEELNVDVNTVQMGKGYYNNICNQPKEIGFVFRC